LYDILAIDRNATSLDIRRAYRSQARTHHPDKGGDAKVFSRIQHAYEVLSDPHRRNVYDTWARELEFRYVKSSTSAQGGEDILLDEFENIGLTCNPHTQLVVTCEVCRRPATKECWTCKMKICEFCTLKRHWKDGYPLHWPLVNSNHMAEKLAMRELESKKKEDARLTDQANPHYRTHAELQDIRDFKDAAYEMITKEDRYRLYDLRIARYYMWAQTDSKVFIACKVPTGYSDKELVVSLQGSVLLIQAENSPPLIERTLSEPFDLTVPIESIRTEDNTMCVLSIQKHEWKHHWTKLFEGDSDGVRCLVAPYELYEGDDDAILQFEVPFWIDQDDVKVLVTDEGVDIRVRNALNVQRTFWRNSEEESRNDDYRVVNTEESSWYLEDDIGSDGKKCKILCVTLVRPELTEDEIQWKKGVRQDNRQGKRLGEHQKKGYRFFKDDEDEFHLEDYLQALCLVDGGRTFVPAKPWDSFQEPRWTSSSLEISVEARTFLENLQKLPIPSTPDQ